MRYELTPTRAFTLGAGLHSKTEAVMTYFAQTSGSDGQIYQPNRDLGLSRAAHAVIGYEQMLKEDVQFKAEAYYQYLFGQPVENDVNSGFWLGNWDGWFTTKDLTNTGTGYNAGVEMSLEKFFTRGWHGMATLSAFESRYTAMDGVLRNSNVMVGKEWKLGGEGTDKVLTTSLRYNVMGGQWYTPIDLEASIATGDRVDGSDLMSAKNDPVQKLDAMIAYRVGRAKVSHEIKMDVQNVLSAETTAYRRYDQRTEKIVPVSQMKMLPLLQYTLRF
jgi:hypothetical protein